MGLGGGRERAVEKWNGARRGRGVEGAVKGEGRGGAGGDGSGLGAAERALPPLPDVWPAAGAAGGLSRETPQLGCG